MHTPPVSPPQTQSFLGRRAQTEARGKLGHAAAPRGGAPVPSGADRPPLPRKGQRSWPRPFPELPRGGSLSQPGDRLPGPLQGLWDNSKVSVYPPPWSFREAGVWEVSADRSPNAEPSAGKAGRERSHGSTAEAQVPRGQVPSGAAALEGGCVCVGVGGPTSPLLSPAVRGHVGRRCGLAALPVYVVQKKEQQAPSFRGVVEGVGCVIEEKSPAVPGLLAVEDSRTDPVRDTGLLHFSANTSCSEGPAPRGRSWTCLIPREENDGK